MYYYHLTSTSTTNLHRLDQRGRSGPRTHERGRVRFQRRICENRQSEIAGRLATAGSDFELQQKLGTELQEPLPEVVVPLAPV